MEQDYACSTYLSKFPFIGWFINFQKLKSRGALSCPVCLLKSLELCHFLHMFLKITSMAESGFGRTENTSSRFAGRNTVIGQWSLPNTVVFAWDFSCISCRETADRARNRKVAASIHARGSIVVFFATATIVYSCVKISTGNFHVQNPETMNPGYTTLGW